MDLLTPLLRLLLGLAGADIDGSMFDHSLVDRGLEALHEVGLVEAGIARFECLTSMSGKCAHTIVPAPCAVGPALAWFGPMQCTPDVAG